MSLLCYDKISRHGLTEVYRPVQDGKRPAAHIIFVHGLFGHPEKTWTGTRKRAKAKQHVPSASTSTISPALSVEEGDAKSARGDGSDFLDVFWPATVLPIAIPNSKIWTWGYDADIDGFWSSASQNTVSQHATNLLSDVADLLEAKNCNLPLIFVVHSLGGLVVKAAMNISSGARGNRFKIVVPRVLGILFLGTPHRGSGSASIGRVAYQITKAATRRPNEKLLQALEKNSDTLDQINNAFIQTIEEHKSIAISSFREEMETRKFLIFSTIVVEADSARIGLAREEINSIPANHRNMAKMSSSEDVGFKRVSAQIRRWIQLLPVNIDDEDEPEYIDCIRSLDSSAAKARLMNVAPSHSETLQWLFDSDEVNFSSWLQNSDNSFSSIYWIQGKPGSGKSTLMKFAMVDHRLSDLLQTSESLPFVIAGFFFHDRGIMVQKSMCGMLQELLHSILLQSPQLRPFVQTAYMSLVEGQKTKMPTWDLKSLQQGFEALMKQRQVATRLCLFLDALDEHHGDNEHLAILVKKLAALADGEIVKIKLCLASRPWDTFVSSFGECPGFKIHDHSYNDIQTYTLSEFHNASPPRTDNTGAGAARSAKLDALAVQVTEKAHGVFIWVRIVVEEIARGIRQRTPLFVLEEMLAKMPEELKDLYEHTLERIEPDHAEESYIMLQIALCALSPLRLDTFVNVTSHSLWGKVPNPGEESTEDMIQRVISRSGGLLEVVEIILSRKVASGSASMNGSSARVANNVWLVSYDDPMQESEPKHEDPVHIVQFIHQTVKEYVQRRRDNLGLKRNQTGGTGHCYILGAVARYNKRWAYRIANNLFEYARLVNLDETFEVQGDLWSSMDTLINTLDYEGLQLWSVILEGVPEFYGRIFDNDMSIRYHVLCLALVAGLFKYLASCLTSSDITNEELAGMVVSVATIGPSITSLHTPRRDMLNFLLQQGFQFNVKRPLVITVAGPLELIMETKGLFDQDETERLSAIAWLLDNGVHGNIDRIFRQCIQQESAEVVRLFGQYGATLPREMIVPMKTVWQMLSTPSEVLEEVMRIMRRNYPDEDFSRSAYFNREIEPYISFLTPIGSVFNAHNPCAAASTMGAVVAMNIGLSRVFAAEYSMIGKLLFVRRR